MQEAVLRYGSLASLGLPGAIAVCVLWQHRNEANGAEGVGPHGVRGWLQFYVLTACYVAPLAALLRTAKALSLPGPHAFDMTQYGTYRMLSSLALALVLVWNWRVAYGLKHEHRPFSVHHALLLLLSAPLVATLLDCAGFYPAFGVDTFGSLVMDAYKGYGWMFAWVLGFLRSKRVRNTCRKPLAGALAAPAKAVA